MDHLNLGGKYRHAVETDIANVSGTAIKQ